MSTVPVKTPLTSGPGLIEWMTNPNGNNHWFGPGIPPRPMAQHTAGRAFDYPVAVNMRWTPKWQEGITFADLRAIADNYDLLRLAIETRKDELEFCEWRIQNREGKQSRASKELQKNLLSPDREHTWHQWQRMLLEELLVTDATAIYARKTEGGDPYSLEVIDGTTIKRILDETGRTPIEGPAYQQVLKGIVTADYERSELFYFPRNVRVNRIYGYSPVEQVVATVNIALRRQAHQLNYYTEGSVPDSIFAVPESWDAGQISEFQALWDSLFGEGNIANRRGARFVPGGVTYINTKEAILKDQYDEWLARIICFAFSISPQALIPQMNKATAEVAEESSKSSGLEPIKNWFKGLMDRIIAEVYERPELEFSWTQKTAIKPREQADIHAIYLEKGVLLPNEVRAELGYEVIAAMDTMDAMDTADIVTTESEESEKLQKSSYVKLPRVKAISRNRADILPLKARLQKAVSNLLQSYREGLLSRLQAISKAEIDLLDILFQYDIDFNPSIDDIEKILAQIAQKGGDAAIQQIRAALSLTQQNAYDLLVNQVNERAVAWAASHAAKLVTDIKGSTRKGIANLVSSGINEGLSVGELAGQIMANYEFSAQRSEMIAITELAEADVMGNKLAYVESGVVSGLQWVTANNGADGRICDECERNHGAIVRLGEDGMAINPYPSGARGVPAHPNCHCDELPVLKEKS